MMMFKDVKQINLDGQEYLRLDYFNQTKYNNTPLRVEIGINEEEQLLIDDAKLDMLENIKKLLDHKVINVNKKELNSILECKQFFEHNNMLCAQLDSNGTYWIKFDDKGVDK